MSDASDYSPEEQDFEGTLEGVSAETFSPRDLEDPELGCGNCKEIDDNYACLACGHHPVCDQTTCCHNYENEELGLQHDAECEVCMAQECCGLGGLQECATCGHDAGCEETDCQEPIHAVTCTGCHASGDPNYFGTCGTCGHLEGCLESDCNKTSHLWLVNRRRPAPAPYGLNAEGAELLICDWLVYLGHKAVKRADESDLSGVQVYTATHIGAVKNYPSGVISPLEIQNIVKAAARSAKLPVLFVNCPLSPKASTIASESDVAVIRYHSKEPRLEPLSPRGGNFLELGKYGQWSLYENS